MRILLTFCFLFVALALPAKAEQITVTPDGPKIITLPENAGSVIVGNPAHAQVVLDTPRTMMIIGREPGMTRVIALGAGGKVIFNEPVIIASGGDQFVRINRACINGGDGCLPVAMYYCKEGERCHNVVVEQPEVSTGGDSGGDEEAMADLMGGEGDSGDSGGEGGGFGEE